jgi:frataxin
MYRARVVATKLGGGGGGGGSHHHPSLLRLRPAASSGLMQVVLLNNKSRWTSSSSSLMVVAPSTFQRRSRTSTTRLHDAVVGHRGGSAVVATMTIRGFQSESHYHTAADETLEDIQDAVEQALEDKGVPDFEVTFASGVLTMVFPPHGTWVLNKQTPNQQIWWSSPLSGPRRYEYDDEVEEGGWVYTRDDSHSKTLVQTLQEELQEIYNVELDLK